MRKFSILIFLSLFVFNVQAQQKAEYKDYIIKYKEGKKSKILQTFKDKSFQHRLVIEEGRVISVPLTSGQLKALQNNPDIEYIEEDIQAELLSQITPYAVSLIQGDLLNDSQASNMKVCIIDTGVQISHEDIEPTNITGGSPAGSGLIWSEPDHSHGTYMAGAVIAQNNSIGVSGVLPNGNVALHAFRIDSSFIPSSDIVAGLYDCQANGANVISISLALSKSRTVQNTVRELTQNNILIYASSGNDGDSTKRYPAAYPEVMAVGAVDKFEQHALYSNTGAHLDFVMPGDAVLGTELMGNGRQAFINIGGDSSYEAVALYNSPYTQASGLLVDCGTMENGCPQASGNICLINAIRTQQQNNNDGSFNVNDQVAQCESEGGLGVIMYGDETEVQYAGLISPDLAVVTIPVATISDTEMNIAYQSLGASTTMSVESGNYIRAFGTSISSPYAAAATALVWSYHPNCSAQDVRTALEITAKDLGASGRDDIFGNGLIQVLDAKLYLDNSPCAGSNNIPPTADFSFSCSSLSCSFDATSSSDSDGSIVSYEWDFGDTQLGNGMTLSHDYASSGSFNVKLTVTDDSGSSSETSQIVSVSNAAIQLTVNGYKVKGNKFVDIMWSGALGNDVLIYRNNGLISTASNTGLYTDSVQQRGSYDYQVCETDGLTCSDIQSVSF